MSLLNNDFIAFDGTPITGRVPTQLLVYADKDYEMSEELRGAVAHAYKLFCDAVKVSAIPNGYHVQNREFADGSKCRIEANGPLHRVMVWPVGGGETEPKVTKLSGMFLRLWEFTHDDGRYTHAFNQTQRHPVLTAKSSAKKVEWAKKVSEFDLCVWVDGSKPLEADPITSKQVRIRLLPKAPSLVGSVPDMNISEKRRATFLCPAAKAIYVAGYTIPVNNLLVDDGAEVLVYFSVGLTPRKLPVKNFGDFHGVMAYVTHHPDNREVKLYAMEVSGKHDTPCYLLASTTHAEISTSATLRQWAAPFGKDLAITNHGDGGITVASDGTRNLYNGQVFSSFSVSFYSDGTASGTLDFQIDEEVNLGGSSSSGPETFKSTVSPRFTSYLAPTSLTIPVVAVSNDRTDKISGSGQSYGDFVDWWEDRRPVYSSTYNFTWRKKVDAELYTEFAGTWSTSFAAQPNPYDNYAEITTLVEPTKQEYQHLYGRFSVSTLTWTFSHTDTWDGKTRYWYSSVVEGSYYTLKTKLTYYEKTVASGTGDQFCENYSATFEHTIVDAKDADLDALSKVSVITGDAKSGAFYEGEKEPFWRAGLALCNNYAVGFSSGTITGASSYKLIVRAPTFDADVDIATDFFAAFDGDSITNYPSGVAYSTADKLWHSGLVTSDQSALDLMKTSDSPVTFTAYVAKFYGRANSGWAWEEDLALGTLTPVAAVNPCDVTDVKGIYDIGNYRTDFATTTTVTWDSVSHPLLDQPQTDSLGNTGMVTKLMFYNTYKPTPVSSSGVSASDYVYSFPIHDFIPYLSFDPREGSYIAQAVIEARRPNRSYAGRVRIYIGNKFNAVPFEPVLNKWLENATFSDGSPVPTYDAGELIVDQDQSFSLLI